MFALLRALIGAQAFSAQVRRVRHEARRAAMHVVFGGVACVLALVGLGFMTAAGHLTLHRALGPVSASLIVGGVYLAIALIVWAIGALSARESPEQAAPQDLAGQDLAGAVQTAFHGIGQTVGDAARKIDPQELATKGGRTIARTVGPLPLAGVAVIAGYLLARRLDRR